MRWQNAEIFSPVIKLVQTTAISREREKKSLGPVTMNTVSIVWLHMWPWVYMQGEPSHGSTALQADGFWIDRKTPLLPSHLSDKCQIPVSPFYLAGSLPHRRLCSSISTPAAVGEVEYFWPLYKRLYRWWGSEEALHGLACVNEADGSQKAECNARYC